MEHLPDSSSISDEEYLQAVSDFAEAFTLDISPSYFHAALIGQISTALAGVVELTYPEKCAITKGISISRQNQKQKQGIVAIPQQATPAPELMAQKPA